MSNAKKCDRITKKDIDEEWDLAEKTGKRQTWWVYPDYQHEPYKRFVKSYTPALAELVRKRNQALLHLGYRIEPFLGEKQ